MCLLSEGIGTEPLLHGHNAGPIPLFAFSKHPELFLHAVGSQEKSLPALRELVIRRQNKAVLANRGCLWRQKNKSICITLPLLPRFPSPAVSPSLQHNGKAQQVNKAPGELMWERRQLAWVLCRELCGFGQGSSGVPDCSVSRLGCFQS